SATPPRKTVVLLFQQTMQMLPPIWSGRIVLGQNCTNIAPRRTGGRGQRVWHDMRGNVKAPRRIVLQADIAAGQGLRIMLLEKRSQNLAWQFRRLPINIEPFRPGAFGPMFQYIPPPD